MPEKSKTYEKSAPRVYIRTFGCQMNDRDSELVSGLLIKEGYTLTDSPKNAEVILFNTCSVRKHAEDRALSVVGGLKGLKEKRPEVIIGVIGCTAEYYKHELFQRLPHIDLVCGPNDLGRIPEILERIKRKRQRILEVGANERENEIYHTHFSKEHTHAYVVISEGCSHFCSYCVVPYVRGTLRSRDYREIISEIERDIEAGARKFTLLGQDVNAYDGEIGFVDLLNRITKLKGLIEVSFITSHPKDIDLNLFYLMRDSKRIKKFLHLPLQSGSNRILSLMNRGYSAEDYLDLVSRYRQIVPKGRLTTDIIVGFPTETEEDFRMTFELMKEIQFDSAYIFKYSPRPKTAASRIADDVAAEEKERRHKVLLEFQKKLFKEKMCKF